MIRRFSLILALGFLSLCNTHLSTNIFLDSSHDVYLKSWIESANDPSTDFPIQNLSLGVFKELRGNNPARIDIAIGDYVFDVRECIQARLIEDLSSQSKQALSMDTLNDFMSLDRMHWL